MGLVCLSCATREFQVRPAPAVARLNRIAVFPLENLSGEPEAGSRVTSVLVTSLYNSSLVNVVEPGEVQQFIIRNRIRVAAQLDADTIREASRQLNADGIVFGSVNEYTVILTDLGPIPAVSVSLRLVDAHTTDMVWSITHSLQGNFRETVFGIGRIDSLGTLSEIVVADVVDALGVAMYPEQETVVKVSPRAVRTELAPARPLAEPVIPLAPTPEEMEAVETERQRAHGAVIKEYETIKGLSE
jgi:TolB-like protein